jgi:hypothetical protein
MAERGLLDTAKYQNHVLGAARTPWSLHQPQQGPAIMINASIPVCLDERPVQYCVMT